MAEWPAPVSLRSTRFDEKDSGKEPGGRERSCQIHGLPSSRDGSILSKRFPAGIFLWTFFAAVHPSVVCDKTSVPTQRLFANACENDCSIHRQFCSSSFMFRL